jgi:cytidylate kinase
MTVWTIAAQEGTGGARLAAELALAADVPLLDRWRISAYKREQLVDRRCAEKALKRDDHGKRAWVKSLYHVDIDDLRLFSLVLDASRFSPGRLVEAMLAAGGVEAARLATELAG